MLKLMTWQWLFWKCDNSGYQHICNPGRNWYVTCIVAYRLHDIFATSWQLYQTAVQFQHLCKWYEWSEHWQNNKYDMLRMFLKSKLKSKHSHNVWCVTLKKFKKLHKNRIYRKYQNLSKISDIFERKYPIYINDDIYRWYISSQPWTVGWTGSNGSRTLRLIFLESNEHHRWHFCDPGLLDLVIFLRLAETVGVLEPKFFLLFSHVLELGLKVFFMIT